MPDTFTDTILLPHFNLVAAMCANGAPTVYGMPTANMGHAARFTATKAKKIYSVLIAWSSISAAGTVTLRIETVNATTGKPTGTLYDANATKTFTPTSGIQTVTFASAPTTNLTIGTEYAIVLLCATDGSIQNLASRVHSSFDYGQGPVIALTASDGTTRSNFADVGSIPVAGLILDDGSYDDMGMCPWYTASGFGLYGTDRSAALKFTLDRSVTIKGFQGGGGFTRNGTPAGDLRVRVLDTSNNVVSSMSYTIDKDSLTTMSARGLTYLFGTPITLPAGTYRLAFDSASSANSVNCFDLRSAVPLNSSLVNSNFGYSTTTNMSGAWTWTDTAGQIPPIGLLIDSVSTGGGGGIRAAGHGGLACAG